MDVCEMKGIFLGLDERMNYVYSPEQKKEIVKGAGMLTTEAVTL